MSKQKKILDDCFALPKGVKWSPVDTALEKLKNGLQLYQRKIFSLLKNQLVL